MSPDSVAYINYIDDPTERISPIEKYSVKAVAQSHEVHTYVYVCTLLTGNHSEESKYNYV
jgi:hypothetical protein